MPDKVLIDFRPNSLIELTRSPDAQEAVDQAAESAADHLRGIAPVHTGNYRDSVRVDRLPGWDGRAGAIVIADVDYAWAVEFVNGEHPLAATADWLQAQQ